MTYSKTLRLFSFSILTFALAVPSYGQEHSSKAEAHVVAKEIDACNAEAKKEGKDQKLTSLMTLGCMLRKADEADWAARKLLQQVKNDPNSDIQNLLRSLDKAMEEDANSTKIGNHSEAQQKVFEDWLQLMEKQGKKLEKFSTLSSYVKTLDKLWTYQDTIQEGNKKRCIISSLPMPKDCVEQCQPINRNQSKFDFLCLTAKDWKNYFSREDRIYNHCEYLLPKSEQIAKNPVIQSLISGKYTTTSPTQKALLDATKQALQAGVPGWMDLIRVSVLSERKSEVRDVIGSASDSFFTTYPKACISSETMKTIWEAPASKEEKAITDERSKILFSAENLTKLHQDAIVLLEKIALRQKEEVITKKKRAGQLRYSDQAQVLDGIIVASLKEHPFFLGSYKIEKSFLSDLKEIISRNKPLLVASVLVKKPPLLQKFAQAETQEAQKKVLEEAIQQVGSAFQNEISDLCKKGKIFSKDAKYQLPQLISYENSLVERDEKREPADQKSLLRIFPEYKQVHECISEAAISRGDHHGTPTEKLDKMSQACLFPVFCSIPQILLATSEYLDYNRMTKLCNEVGSICTEQDQEKLEELRSAWKVDAILSIAIGASELSHVRSALSGKNKITLMSILRSFKK